MFSKNDTFKLIIAIIVISSGIVIIDDWELMPQFTRNTITIFQIILFWDINLNHAHTDKLAFDSC